MSFQSETSERRWVKGERISELRKSARHNAPLDAIDEIKEYLGHNLGDREEDWIVTWHSLGKILETSIGLTQYNGALYKVEISIPKPGVADFKPLEVETDKFEQTEFRTVDATNIAEIKSQTHAIGTDEIVHLFVAIRERASPSPKKSTGSIVRYFFSSTPPGGLTVKDCADAGGPATTEKFAGGFTVSFSGSVANVAPNIIADPACPGGISITNGNGATCGPVKISNTGVSDVKYVAGVFYKTVCGIDYVVFSTTACPTAPGAPSAEFFAYNN